MQPSPKDPLGKPFDPGFWWWLVFKEALICVRLLIFAIFKCIKIKSCFPSHVRNIKCIKKRKSIDVAQ